jgi:hypothetical protein
MRINVLFVIGLICAVLAVTLFAALAVKESFPVFSNSDQTGSFVSITQDVGGEDSSFMWNNNGLALIAQAFVLFAAAAAALGLLKSAEEKKSA